MTRPTGHRACPRRPPGGAWSRACDLAAALPELEDADWSSLAEFDNAVHRALGDDVGDGGTRPRAARVPDPRDGDRQPEPPKIGASTVGRLLALRRVLVAGTVPFPAAASAADIGRLDVRAGLAQTLRQFLVGYHDLDLRDVSGPGHGRMILRHGQPDVAATWARRLGAGELAGAAMTEAHGGSRLRPLATRLSADGPGRWRLNGHKRWISRLHEASVFVVSAAHPDGHTAAVLVDAAHRGLRRERTEPAGLAGWSWGALEFDNVGIGDDDLLTRDHRTGGGQAAGPPEVFTEHFAHYRQLVTATAIGAAVSVQDTVAALLAGRLARGEITWIGDHALITLGSADAALHAALHASLHTVRLAALAHPDAVARSAAVKAHGIETARRAADELAALAGAAGFAHAHPVAKARRDLEALRFADGAHDSLRRHAGSDIVRGHLLRAGPADRDLPAAAPEPPRAQ